MPLNLAFVAAVEAVTSTTDRGIGPGVPMAIAAGGSVA